jgi:hypothetical protein
MGGFAAGQMSTSGTGLGASGQIPDSNLTAIVDGTTRASIWLLYGAVLLAVAGFLLLDILATWPTNVVPGGLCIVILVFVSEVLLTRWSLVSGQNHLPIQLVTGGLEAPLKPEPSYKRMGKAFALRSALLRRSLGGFTRPNRLDWSEDTIVTIRRTENAEYQSSATIHVVDRAGLRPGPRLAFNHLQLWLSSTDQNSLVIGALKAGAHVHLDVDLLAPRGTESRICPLNLRSDPLVQGSCLVFVNVPISATDIA